LTVVVAVVDEGEGALDLHSQGQAIFPNFRLRKLKEIASAIHLNGCTEI
jgi:hypothetical protein